MAKSLVYLKTFLPSIAKTSVAKIMRIGIKTNPIALMIKGHPELHKESNKIRMIESLPALSMRAGKTVNKTMFSSSLSGLQNFFNIEKCIDKNGPGIVE